MNKGTRVICKYLTGGGDWHEEGEFKITKITDKIVTLEMLKEGFFVQYPDKKVRKLPTPQGKRTAFCPAIEWGDNEVCIYHESRGIPFVYEFVGSIDTPEKPDAFDESNDLRDYKELK